LHRKGTITNPATESPSQRKVAALRVKARPRKERAPEEKIKTESAENVSLSRFNRDGMGKPEGDTLKK